LLSDSLTALPVGRWAGRWGPARSFSILGIAFYSQAKRELNSEASDFRPASEHFKLICQELVQFGVLKMRFRQRMDPSSLPLLTAPHLQYIDFESGSAFEKQQ
jgi:hypothetical protein